MSGLASTWCLSLWDGLAATGVPILYVTDLYLTSDVSPPCVSSFPGNLLSYSCFSFGKIREPLASDPVLPSGTALRWVEAEGPHGAPPLASTHWNAKDPQCSYI